MDIQTVIAELQQKFGNKLDVAKVKEMFKGHDLNNFSMTEIIDKVKNGGLIGDLDGDGKQEGIFDEIKGKATEVFGSIFGK